MNLATSSLIIFLLLSPAILARRLYFTRELSKDFTIRNTLQEIFSSIFLALLLHAVWSLFALIPIFGDGVNFEFILKALLDSRSIQNYDSFSNHVGQIFLYFFTLYLVAGIGSYKLKSIIRKYGLDRKYDVLEFDNTWSYLISGEVLDIKRYKKHNTYKRTSADIDARYADILIKSEDDIVYSGIIVDFQLNSSSLEYLVLTEARKFLIIKIKDAAGNVIDVKPIQVNMPSHYLVIPYSDVLNINLRYIDLLNDFSSSPNELQLMGLDAYELYQSQVPKVVQVIPKNNI